MASGVLSSGNQPVRAVTTIALPGFVSVKVRDGEPALCGLRGWARRMAAIGDDRGDVSMSAVPTCAHRELDALEAQKFRSKIAASPAW
jgi:hypothetical protein